jgi:hypothetical protein
MGATLGHEIEHTTNANYTLSRTGKDAEKPAYNVSDKIIKETKDNQKAAAPQEQPKNSTYEKNC